MKRLLCLFLLLLTSCASGGLFGGSGEPSSYNFTIEMPDQWTRVNTKKYFMLTKDGAFSQYILVQQRHLNKPFRNTKKKIKKGMVPQEAAQVIVDEITSDRSVQNFQLIENLPATVNRYDGFKIVFSYETKERLKFQTIYYGFLQGDWYYSLRYNAGERHYSAEDVETFRKVLSSFKILEAGSA